MWHEGGQLNVLIGAGRSLRSGQWRTGSDNSSCNYCDVWRQWAQSGVLVVGGGASSGIQPAALQISIKVYIAVVVN